MHQFDIRLNNNMDHMCIERRMDIDFFRKSLLYIHMKSKDVYPLSVNFNQFIEWNIAIS